MDQQDGDGRGGDPGDAGGLAERERPDFFELLADFIGEAGHGIVVKIGGKAFFLQVKQLFDRFQLAVNIAFIFNLDFDLFADRRRDRGRFAG